jgi:hypothetical protein
MAGCGCSATKASGDPHGRSISSLAGLPRKAKATCKYEKRAGKRKLVCRDARGRVVARKKPSRGRR